MYCGDPMRGAVVGQEADDNSNLLVLLQERSTFSLKFFPSWITNSTFQPNVIGDSDHSSRDSSGLVVDGVVSSRLANAKSINWLRSGVRLYALKQNISAGKQRCFHCHVIRQLNVNASTPISEEQRRQESASGRL